MAENNDGLLALVQKVAPRAVWSTIHRKSIVPLDMGEDLLTAFEIIIRVVGFIQNIPLRGWIQAKLCDDIDS